jgi:hypothetical protein
MTKRKFPWTQFYKCWFLSWMSNWQTFFLSQDMQGMWSNTINMPLVPRPDHSACKAILVTVIWPALCKWSRNLERQGDVNKALLYMSKTDCIGWWVVSVSCCLYSLWYHLVKCGDMEVWNCVFQVHNQNGIPTIVLHYYSSPHIVYLWY